MFQKNFDNPGDFNTIVKPLMEMAHKRSDNGNGYFIVSETWGSCFFRLSHTRKEIQIQDHKQPRAHRTYTKIPVAVQDKIFFLYVNYQSGKSFEIDMPRGSRVIGMHDHQSSRCGRWINASVLIFSPEGIAPTVTETEQDTLFDALRLVINNEQRIFTIDQIMRGKEVRRIQVNEEGFAVTSHNHPEGPLEIHIEGKASFSIADILTQ